MPFTPVGSMQTPDTGQGVSLTTVTVGDLLVCQVVGHDPAVFCTGISSSGTEWTQIGSPVIGTVSGWSAVPFLGKVITPGTNDVTQTWSGTPPTFHTRVREFFVTSGNWSLDKLGNIDTSGTSSWASLTASGPHELYWGWTTNTGNAVAGSQLDWTYEIDGDGDGEAFNPDCGPGAVQAVWSDSGQGMGLMMLIKENPPGLLMVLMG
jgi:hypothetical protein